MAAMAVIAAVLSVGFGLDFPLLIACYAVAKATEPCKCERGRP